LPDRSGDERTKRDDDQQRSQCETERWFHANDCSLA
jgi:hypothetical protein